MTTGLRSSLRVVLAFSAFLGWFIPQGAKASEPTSGATLPAEPPLSEGERSVLQKAQAERIAAINKVYSAVVCVFGSDPSVGGGSGVLIDPCGLTLTNHHVVAAAGAEGFGGLSDGRLYRWRLIGTDPGGDIALIQLQRKEPFPISTIGDSDALRVGDWALVMGNPFALADNYQPSVTMGIISGLKRFQPGGGGKNQLIYGNCIQVDASINPGNSGGPLFNLQSQLVGINGRGSFKERGRVNVGLGYAVSVRQILNFIPDLLATKIALHGTLDSLFANRGNKVVCSTIDLDSPAARAGLELGDDIVSFDGEQIADANDFTNLITTLPAGWPVRLIYRRAGRTHAIEVPLSPLPYALQQPQEEKDPHEPPPDVPGQSSIAHAVDGSNSPHTDDPPVPRRPGRPQGLGKKWNLANAGSISEPLVNQEHARRIIGRWSDSLRNPGDDKSPAGWRIKSSLSKAGKSVGHQECLIASDGRFRVDVTLGDTSESFGFDGKEFWRAHGDAAAEVLTPAQWLEQPLRLQALAVAASVRPDMLSAQGTWSLDGGDRIQQRRSYRVQWKGSQESSLFLWLSLDVQGDLTRQELLGIGAKGTPDERGSRILFSNHRSQGVVLPWKSEIVTGVSRAPELTIIIDRCDPETTLPDSSLQKPGHDKK